MADRRESCPGLKLLCFLAVRKHFSHLAPHTTTVLPCDLLEELQPHLTVGQLDQLQPALNARGVSTLSGWSHILRHMRTPSCVVNVGTEEEAKLRVMTDLFNSVLYDLRNDYISSNLSSLDNSSFLGTAAKYIRNFALLNRPEPLRRLTRERRSVLLQLERHVCRVRLSHRLDPSKSVNQPALQVLHRLLDHGQVRGVVFEAHCPHTLAWILHRRGCQASNTSARGSPSDEHQGPAFKRPRLDSHLGHREDDGECDRRDGVAGDGKVRRVTDEGDGALGDCWSDQGPSSACPHRPIEDLELRHCQADCLRVLLCALPSWSSLRFLTLHSFGTLSQSSALDLAGALQELSSRPGAGLLQFNICTLPCPSMLERLVEACPRLLSLSAEVYNSLGHSPAPAPPTALSDRQFPLQSLSINLNQQLTPGLLIPSLIRRCPQLRSLHVSGLRLQSEASYGRLLSSLSESCGSLRRLILEDVNLSNSLEHILLLLKRCHLNDLNLRDCRLLEKWTDKEESLKLLTTALADHRTLTSVGLAHNRIAKHVPVLAQLFSGAPDSALERVDLSSNFIQADELLEFSHRLAALRPTRRLTLDLRRNPGDRDPDSWRSAVSRLAPYCHLLLEGWTSTDTMVDHVSSM